MRIFLAHFSWGSRVIYMDLEGWALISVPDVNWTAALVLLKAKFNSKLWSSPNLFFLKCEYSFLQQGKSSHRRVKCLFELEHSEPEHIINLAISYYHFHLRGSSKHAAASIHCLRLTTYLIITHRRGQFYALDHTIN